MTVFKRIRSLFPARSRSAGRGAEDASDSYVMDSPSGLSPSTFGGESVLVMPAPAGAAQAVETPGAAPASPAAQPSPVDALDALDDDAGERLNFPLLGRRTLEQHQRSLVTGMVFMLVVAGALAGFQLYRAGQARELLYAASAAQIQAQRLAKSATLALQATPGAFAEVRQSGDALAEALTRLQDADPGLGPVREKSGAALATLLAQENGLMATPGVLAQIRQRAQEMQEAAEALQALKLQQGAPVPELSAAAQLVQLPQRIAQAGAEYMTPSGLSPQSVVDLGQDLKVFKELIDAQLTGSAALRLAAVRDPRQRELLVRLSAGFAPLEEQVQSLVEGLARQTPARQAQQQLLADSEPLRVRLGTLQSQFATQSTVSTTDLIAPALASVGALLCMWGLLHLQLLGTRQRQMQAEEQRMDASAKERDARRVNDATQAAILRLMNELQEVADGNLTQQATVTEDITGAIADSINYTVEELRNLVSQVQTTAQSVSQTTAKVENTSIELLATSTEQLREIRETGQAVLDMARRIQRVSGQAQASAQVARQSLQAAETGLTAVQDSMGGMNLIRDQIQDTAKRIKRLGESSQEIGEITELISDITEQTNVLALNAAIQAAAAGEAGRGFSVVAEEVQRLAERSGDATKQIALLVRAIQTDTQDAVSAMEQSTRGVVEGARLSDNAGAALAEIDRFSRQVAELVEQIAQSTSQEAEMANGTAGNIQHIFAVTEQTGEGTKSTVQQVRELTRMANALRESVSRFKIG